MLFKCENFLKVTTGLQKKEHSKHKEEELQNELGIAFRMTSTLLDFKYV